MAEIVQPFYGRRFDHVWLRAKLFPVQAAGLATPVVLIHGPAGAGKTALSQRILNPPRAGPDPFPLLVLSSSDSAKVSGLIDFSRGLMQSARCTLQPLQAQLHHLRDSFSQQQLDFTRERAPVEAYNLDGSARAIALAEAPPMDPDGLALARTMTLATSNWLTQFADAEGKSRLLRLLFILDAFPKLPPVVKNWVGDTLLAAIQQQEQMPEVAFLLTAEESWEVGGQADYWRAHPGSFHQRELGPLSRADCLQWLTDAGVNPDWVDVILEETEAMPGRIHALLADRAALELRVNEGLRSSDLSIPLGPQERRWLHAAAMAERVCTESLQVLLGMDDARAAWNWLLESCPLETVRSTLREGEKWVYLSASTRERILKLSVAKVPTRHREFLEKMELYTRVTTKVPSAEAREQLRRIAPVQPFNMEMLKEVFGGDE